MARTVDQIIADAISFLNSVQPNLSTLVGTVTHDAVIESPSLEFANVYTELDRVSEIQSLDFPDVMTTAELNALGDNYGSTRNGGTFSQGTITFRVVNLQNIEPNINIPVGTIVSTSQTATAPIVAFATTIASTIIASQAASYFNPITGFYELTIPIQSQQVGSSSNVSAGAISTLSSNISRIFAVTNTVATTGGTDQESNTDYAARIKLKLSGNNLGTLNGIKSLAQANANVLDVSVVGPNDFEMLRNEFGGSIDVYILGTVDVSTTDTNTFTTTGTRTFIMSHQPAVVISGSVTVSGIAGAAPIVFVEGIDYMLVQDSTTLLDGSTRLQNGIMLLNTGTLPDNNTQFTMTYSYNQLIETLQNIFNSDSNHIVTSDILVKQTHQALIDISASVSVIPGFNTPDTLSAAQTAVTNFLNTNKLGASFNQSQIVATIENTPGVGEVDLTTLVIKKNSVVITTQTVTIDKTEDITTNTINLAIIV